MSAHTPAVVDGKLHHWSPSQIGKYRLCPRRWWFSKVAGIREPGSRNMDLGKAVHSFLENYYLSGELVCTEEKIDAEVVDQARGIATTAVESGQIPSRAGLKFPEVPAEEPTLLAAGVPLEGYIDLLDITDPDEIGIVDWKTRSDFRFVHDEESLGADVQMVTYAAWAKLKHKASKYKLTHTYLKTKGKTSAVLPVSTTISAQQVQDRFVAIEDTVREMSTCASVADVADVTPNWDESNPAGKAACFEWFRPCPFMSECAKAIGKFTPPLHILEELSTMSLSEKVEAHRAARATGTEPAAPVRASGINPPDAATHATTPPVAGATEATSAPIAGTTTATNTLSGELIIFVDCQPTKGMDGVAVVRLEDEIAIRSKPIADAAKVSDVREIKYSEGVTRLIADFKRNPPRGMLLANNVGIAANVLETLSALPGVIVIRALR